ncbi:MAG: SGNH/GDSL hydrolase family protein [Telluria sp.]
MRQLYEYHPVVGYRFIPNLKARIPHEGGGYLVHANEAGFRSNRPFLKTVAPGTRRVLFFGDSFTAGDAVTNHQRYTDVLEARLDAILPGKVEAYNFGISSTGTDQQYLAWKEFARDVEHDLLVIAVFVENIRRVMAHYRPHRDADGVERIYAKPYFALDSGSLLLRNVPPRATPFELDELSPAEQGAVDTGGRFALLRKVVNAVGAKDAVQRLTRYQPLPAYDSPAHPGWLLMRAILSEWIRAAPKPVVLMPLPLPQHLDGVCDAAPYQARFAELAAELKCTLHDPLPAFMRYPAPERRDFRWETDIHYTPAGHRALAESLVPVLKRLLLQSTERKGSTCPG